MTALTRVRAALAAGERPSDDDVRAVCADAGRYVWLRMKVRGQRDELAPEGQDFVLTPPGVLPKQNIMRGSVAEHFDAALDAALREPN